MLSKLALDLCCAGLVASRFGSKRCFTSNGDKSIHTLPIRFDLNSVTHPLTKAAAFHINKVRKYIFSLSSSFWEELYLFFNLFLFFKNQHLKRLKYLTSVVMTTHL